MEFLLKTPTWLKRVLALSKIDEKKSYFDKFYSQ